MIETHVQPHLYLDNITNSRRQTWLIFANIKSISKLIKIVEFQSEFGRKASQSTGLEH